jgi:oligopeptide/dipeptide ABC transporter ATP-binding protein
MTDLVEVHDLVKTFRAGGTILRAVDGVSFSIPRGQTFGLVGESGSGKSTVARCVLRLMLPDSGSVIFGGQDLSRVTSRQMRALRSKIQVVFQDPHGSLNRRMPVSGIIAVPLIAHGAGTRRERSTRTRELLDLVQLPTTIACRLPGELSGGQAQRVAIARALALRPDLVVLDEAVSALDVSVRAQILNLLSDLQRDLGLTYLFISHDLSVVRYIAQRVSVMYRGRIVEQADRTDLFTTPRHPYTDALLNAVPRIDLNARDRLRPAVPEPDDTSDLPLCGCAFQARCAVGIDRSTCAATVPNLRPVGNATSLVACHYPEGAA